MLWNYKKINNCCGWMVFLIALQTYVFTAEPVASFWDVGEFIAASYRLQIPHAPGAPLFLLIGKMFSFLSFGNNALVAYWLNITSAVFSAFTILFLFWTISLLAKKLLKVSEGNPSLKQTITIMGASSIGALSYAFSDSFWFSAVEAEVYAVSSFFTAFTAWAILKWEQIDDESQANKWILMIAYVTGLSIGVHLLNLLTIPALAMVVYFKKFKPSLTGGIIAFLAGGTVLLIIMTAIIPGLPKMAFSFELFFVNILGLPFGSGIMVFSILLLSGIVYGVFYSVKKVKPVLNTIVLCFALILTGYSSYGVILVRSAYNPPMDTNSPDSINSFIYYLQREQYGERPLFHGPFFTAKVVDQISDKPWYAKGTEKYEIIDYNIKNVYDPAHTTVFPRVYHSDERSIQIYQNVLGLRKGEKPGFADNLKFLFQYQLGHMYFRYFMWNFAGRSSDKQNDGWLSPFSSDSAIPSQLASNKARNQFYMLPLVLGLIGMIFHSRKETKGFAYVGILFFMTGVALVLYLNSPPAEPRERDYAYVGSFYAFSVWIGMGIIAVSEIFNYLLKEKLWAPVIAIVLCGIAPLIMAKEGWDDHDRSQRYFSVDSARNFLASCAPNAILFTNGDNHTYPLWYVQDVEGFRQDVRVVVLTYLAADWYIDKARKQQYSSDPLPVSLTETEYRRGSPNDYLPFINMNLPAVDLRQYIQLLKKGHQALEVPTSLGYYHALPSKNIFLKVNKFEVLARKIIPEGMDHLLVDKMFFKIKSNGLYKNDLILLDIIQSNNWERPVYFSSASIQELPIDLHKYLVQEGITYRLLPVENPDPEQGYLVNTELMRHNLMEKYAFRNLDQPDIYYDEQYHTFASIHREAFNNLANAYLVRGDKKKAKEVIERSLSVMPDESIPYDSTSSETIAILFRIEERQKAYAMAKTVGERAVEWISYLKKTKKNIGVEFQKNIHILFRISRILAAEGYVLDAEYYYTFFLENYDG